ncbi:hypothetical protein U1Q18_007771 [Sarracenia purpurea var. burkii]
MLADQYQLLVDRSHADQPSYLLIGSLSPPSSFPILGFACEEVRRKAERPTLADVGAKTGAGLPYAAPGRLRPRMRGESRTKAPLMEKIDLSKSSVSALQYETAMGPPRKFQDVVALLTSIAVPFRASLTSLSIFVFLF